MTGTTPFVYSIKRHGTTLETCESEPVHTPGCVQSHGVLFALRPSDLTVQQVSDNCTRHLGREPSQILGQSATAVFGENCAADIQRCLTNESPEKNPVFACSLDPHGPWSGFDVTVHTVDGVVIVELERTTRKPNALTDHYSLVRRTISRLQAAPTLEELFRTVVADVRRMTGLCRVMVYRFHPDESGEIVAEDVREGMVPFLGLRYPSHDIPRQSREIFKKIWIRPIHDCGAELSEMVPLANPDTGRPLEMTYCSLRGVSAMHAQYLRNMGVAAALTLSLVSEGKLWGLITCHHDTPTAFSYEVRAACELLAQFTSLQIAPTRSRETAHYRLQIEASHTTMLARAAREGGVDALAQGSPSLLDGIRCGGAAVFYSDRLCTAGNTPDPIEVTVLARWLSDRIALKRDEPQVFATDRLATEFSDAASYTGVGAGVLAVPISGNPHNMVLWFRPELERTVRWGGDPNDVPQGPARQVGQLGPRSSFESWKQTVRGQSEPWSDLEVEAALRLKILLMDLVIRRADALAEVNRDLTRSNEELDSFAYIASHDLKEPLRGINKHAQIIHEDIRAGRVLEQKAVERLEAVLRLTARMDGLLDSLLHFSRLGRLQLDIAEVPLSKVVEEAIEMLGAHVSVSGATIRIPRPFPMLRCEWIRAREVFSNLIGNAIKYNDKVDKWVEVGFIDPAQTPPSFFRSDLAPPESAGQVVLYVRDNGIGIESRHYEHMFRIFKRLHGREAYGGGAGVGLAIVKKLVAQHQGVVWVDSTPGQGSTFYFTLTQSGGSSK